MNITILNRQKRILLTEQVIRKLKSILQYAFLNEGCDKCAQLSLCLLNNKTVKMLNRRYLRHNTTTDVIAFRMPDYAKRDAFIADIAVSTDTAAKNAKIYGTSPLYELYLYSLHGALHVMGYTDAAKPERIIMEKKTKLILSHFLLD